MPRQNSLWQDDPPRILLAIDDHDQIAGRARRNGARLSEHESSSVSLGQANVLASYDEESFDISRIAM